MHTQHSTPPMQPHTTPIWGTHRALDPQTQAHALAMRQALIALNRADGQEATAYDTGVHDGYTGGFRWGCLSGFCWGCAAGALATMAALHLGWMLGV